MSEPIQQLFENLDSWRHLPAYQLERRADVFFSVYLHPMLAERFGARLLAGRSAGVSAQARPHLA
jgi:hypothetical protein